HAGGMRRNQHQPGCDEPASREASERRLLHSGFHEWFVSAEAVQYSGPISRGSIHRQSRLAPQLEEHGGIALFEFAKSTSVQPERAVAGTNTKQSVRDDNRARQTDDARQQYICKRGAIVRPADRTNGQRFDSLFSAVDRP